MGRYRKLTEADYLANEYGCWFLLVVAWLIIGMVSFILLIIGGGKEKFTDQYLWTLIPYCVVLITVVSKTWITNKKLEEIEQKEKRNQ